MRPPPIPCAHAIQIRALFLTARTTLANLHALGTQGVGKVQALVNQLNVVLDALPDTLHLVGSSLSLPRAALQAVYALPDTAAALLTHPHWTATLNFTRDLRDTVAAAAGAIQPGVLAGAVRSCSVGAGRAIAGLSIPSPDWPAVCDALTALRQGAVQAAACHPEDLQPFARVVSDVTGLSAALAAVQGGVCGVADGVAGVLSRVQEGLVIGGQALVDARAQVALGLQGIQAAQAAVQEANDLIGEVGCVDVFLIGVHGSGMCG